MTAKDRMRTMYIHPCHKPSTVTEPNPKFTPNQGRKGETNSTTVAIAVMLTPLHNSKSRALELAEGDTRDVPVLPGGPGARGGLPPVSRTHGYAA